MTRHAAQKWLIHVEKEQCSDDAQVGPHPEPHPETVIAHEKEWT